jgi:hypothetical protein
MSDFARHIVGHASCQCSMCLLINHGGISGAWEGWADIAFEVDMKIATVRLTRRLPMLWPRSGTVSGERPWFDLLGIGLVFGGTD